MAEAASGRLDPSDDAEAARDRGVVRRWCIGLFYILLVALIWTFSSVLVQFIFRAEHFDAPIFLTYVCNTLFVINLPLLGIRRVLKAATRRAGGPGSAEVKNLEATALLLPSNATAVSATGVRDPGDPNAASSASSQASDHMPQASGGTGRGGLGLSPPAAPSTSADASTGGEAVGIDGGRQQLEERRPQRLGTWGHLWISARIAPLWFVANCSYNWSLDELTVTTSTVISTTSCMWTYAFSVACAEEAPSRRKLLGVALCMAGNVCSAFAPSSGSGDSGPGASSVPGVLVCVLGAVMYAAYTTLLRWDVEKSGGDEAVSMSFFFAGLGLIAGVCLLPLVLVLHISGIEPLSGLTWEILGFVVLKGLLDNVLSDYLWAKAVLYTSPTVATVGLSLTIPLAIPADSVSAALGRPGGAAGVPLNAATGAAALLVLGGFGLLSL